MRPRPFKSGLEAKTNLEYCNSRVRVYYVTAARRWCDLNLHPQEQRRTLPLVPLAVRRKEWLSGKWTNTLTFKFSVNYFQFTLTASRSAGGASFPSAAAVCEIAALESRVSERKKRGGENKTPVKEVKEAGSEMEEMWSCEDPSFSQSRSKEAFSSLSAAHSQLFVLFVCPFSVCCMPLLTLISAAVPAEFPGEFLESLQGPPVCVRAHVCLFLVCKILSTCRKQAGGCFFMCFFSPSSKHNTSLSANASS